MPREVRVLPHRPASSDSVEWGPLWLTVNGHREPAGDLVDAWDYASETVVDYDVRLDLDMVRSSTGLDETATIAVATKVDCPTALTRLTSAVPYTGEDGPVTSISLSIPAGSVADAIVITRHLIVLDPPSPAPDGVADRAGARLHEAPRTRVRLEGAGGRFPTEAVPFSELGLEPAAWRVDLTCESLDNAFLGAVRLIVNTEHPAAAALDAGHEAHDMILTALRCDVVRQLLSRLAFDNTLEVDERGYEDGSVGSVLETICDLHLGRDLPSVLELARQDAPGFEMLAQARLGFLSKVPT